MLSLLPQEVLWANANQIAAENSSAPVSALVWWIIPVIALTGGLAYAYWVTRLKSKYENQTERSVGRFKKFQDSFDQDSFDQDSFQKRRDRGHNQNQNLQQKNLEVETSNRDER
jgi:hypothetical protein